MTFRKIFQVSDDSCYIRDFFLLVHDKTGKKYSEILKELIINCEIYSEIKETKNLISNMALLENSKKSKADARVIFEVANFEKRIIVMLCNPVIDIDEIFEHIQSRKTILNFKESNGWKFIFSLTKKKIIDVREDLLILKNERGFGVQRLVELGFDGISKIIKKQNLKLRILNDVFEADKDDN